MSIADISRRHKVNIGEISTTVAVWLNYSRHCFSILRMKRAKLNEYLLKSIDSIASLIQFVWKETKNFQIISWKLLSVTEF